MDRRDMIRTTAGAVAAAATGGGNGSAAEEATIARRPLGRTGEQVSIMGLGGAHIGTQKDEQESIAHHPRRDRRRHHLHGQLLGL